jgi:hypothetical protein
LERNDSIPFHVIPEPNTPLEAYNGKFENSYESRSKNNVLTKEKLLHNRIGDLIAGSIQLYRDRENKMLGH